MDKKTVLTCGTFDLFHIGHLNLLTRAKALGDKLVVGVSSDFLNLSKKNRTPVIPLYERIQIIKSLKCVDEVFIEDDISLEAKSRYMHYYNANIFLMGDDWKDKFDELPIIYKSLYPKNIKNIQVLYLTRTTNMSTTDILYNKLHCQLDQVASLSSLLPIPNDKLLNVKKTKLKAIFHCRNQPHQAVHVLPYYYFFEPENVYWYYDIKKVIINIIKDDKKETEEIIEITRSEEDIENDIRLITKKLEAYTNIKIDRKQIIINIEETLKYDLKVAFITEPWKPHMDFYRENNIKVLFLDHGICVGTRPKEWFAHYWHNCANYDIVAGNLQYDYHLKCSGLPQCHNLKKENIFRLFGWPRFNFYSPCEWIWEMNKINKTNNKRILICPTSYYDNYNTIINIIVKLCQNYDVVIRPHPITEEMAKPNSVLLKIFNLCIEQKCAQNLIIIPPQNIAFTMNLFNCDLAIFDQSSVAYEYLLVDKPGIIIADKLDMETISIKDGLYYCNNIEELNQELIEKVIQDPLEFKQKRNNLKNLVFAKCDNINDNINDNSNDNINVVNDEFNNDDWINNFSEFIEKNII